MHSFVIGKGNMNNNLCNYLSQIKGRGKQILSVQAPGVENSKYALI
jgi:hypothetical protein